jgi:predicted nucleic acid-binding protein
MPTISIPAGTFDFGRRAALLDTNVLVALHDDQDNNHEQTVLVLEEESSYQWLVTVPVIVESCGLLGARRSETQTYSLLLWLLDPGSNVVIMPELYYPKSLTEATQDHKNWMRRYSVDYVDASLMKAADHLTRTCELRPHAPVFTFDTGDYFKCCRQGYLYSLFDMKTAELLDFST